MTVFQLSFPSVVYGLISTLYVTGMRDQVGRHGLQPKVISFSLKRIMYGLFANGTGTPDSWNLLYPL